jgi:hypothetical protein
MPDETKNERDVFQIIIWGTAVAFGFLAAALQALRPTPAGFTFQVSPLTFFAFAVGTGVFRLFWKIILNGSGGARQKSARFWAELALLVLGMAAFLYPLRFVPSEKLPEMITGLVTAAFALSMLGGLLVMAGRFFESDGGENQSSSDDAARAQSEKMLPPKPSQN